MNIKNNTIINSIFNNFFKNSFDQQIYKNSNCINKNNIIKFICLNRNVSIPENIKGFYIEILFNEIKYIIYNDVDVNYSYELISYFKNIDNKNIYNINKLILIENEEIKLNYIYLIPLLCLLCFLNSKIDMLKYENEFDYIVYKYLNYKCIIKINKKNKILVNTKINISFNNFNIQLFITDNILNEMIDLFSIIKQQNLIFIDINILIKYKLFKNLLTIIKNN